MPIATVTNESIRFELKTLPGAWVDIKPLSHGQMIHRREISTKQALRDLGKGGTSMDIELIQKAAILFEYKHCIVDHNLEELGAKGEPFKMDLTNPATIEKLNPKVGAEIDTLIGKLNNFEEEDDNEGN